MDLKTRTVQMLTSAEDWPMLILPVKNTEQKQPDGFPKLGYVLEPAHGGQGPLTIYIGNMFDVDPANDLKVDFRDVAQAVHAGWRVD